MKGIARLAAAAGAAASASVLAVGTAGSAHSSLPGSLAGRWHRNIVVDLRKLGAPAIPSGMYHLTIQPAGRVRVLDAQRNTFDGSLAVVAKGQVVIKVDICQNGLAAKSKNLYRWRVVGAKLTFALVRDSECSDRVALFRGTWLKG
jgi:hypothetical protein